MSSGRGSVTKIELPASGSVALDLSSVSNLAMVNNGVTNKTSLTSITFPTSNYTLGEKAFDGSSNLSGSIDISQCTSIGRWAFRDCSGFTSLILGSNITTIPHCAFYNCSGLTGSVDFSHITLIDGEAAFKGCSGLIGTINLSSCTSVGSHAFENCTGITSANLPNCTTIGDFAFNGCTNLTSVTFGSNITTIGQGAFDDSDATFYFFSSPHTVTYGGANTFKNGAKAFWDDGMQQYIYKWNRSANSGNGGWDPF